METGPGKTVELPDAECVAGARVCARGREFGTDALRPGGVVHEELDAAALRERVKLKLWVLADGRDPRVPDQRANSGARGGG